MEKKDSKSRIFVFGHPPSASSLLKRMLEKHPRLDVSDISFREAYTLGPERLERHDQDGAHYSEDRTKASHGETYQKAFDKLHKSMTRAENKGKRPLFTEDAYVIFRPDITSTILDRNHSLTNIPTPVIMTSKTMPTNYRCPLRASNSLHSSDSSLFTATFPIFHPITEGLGIHTIESRSPNPNPTVLPDAFLKSMTPICLIRHPARTFPSLHRAAHLNIHGPEFSVQASLRWCRLLVDWYAVATGTEPLVLDSDDLVHKPATIKIFCGAVSLDESVVQTSWDAISQAEIREQDAVNPAMTATVQTTDSMGRSRKENGEIDIDEEERSWVEEFGVDAAEAIKGFVVGAMDDYSYLKQLAPK